jgi:hypothetical protein
MIEVALPVTGHGWTRLDHGLDHGLGHGPDHRYGWAGAEAEHGRSPSG